jgi:hypothetical protein
MYPLPFFPYILHVVAPTPAYMVSGSSVFGASAALAAEFTPSWRASKTGNDGSSFQQYQHNRSRQPFRDRHQGYGQQQQQSGNSSNLLSQHVFANLASLPPTRYRTGNSPPSYSGNGPSNYAGSYSNASISAPSAPIGNTVGVRNISNVRPDRAQNHFSGNLRRPQPNQRFPYEGNPVSQASVSAAPISFGPELMAPSAMSNMSAVAINPLSPPLGSPILPELPLTARSFYFFRPGFGQLLVGLLPRFVTNYVE